MRIGVIADTHGRVLPAVLEAFRGVSLILHAGDIGGEQVIVELEAVANVVAVRGNIDAGLSAPRYPDTRRFTLEGVDIFLCHQPERAFGLSTPPDLIIHGHTHIARDEMKDDVRWFNPGTAGKAQFAARALTVGLLTLEGGQVTAAEIIPLAEIT